MTWLIWRQHRNQVALAGIALGALAIVLAITGVHMASTYHSALRSCGATGSCDSVGDGLFNGDGAVIDLVNFTVVVPLILGLFWGAPVVAREIEEGTHMLIWTQSVTRRHWLAGKTVALLCATASIGGVLAVAVTWWSRTLDLSQHNRFNKFDVQGIVPVAYAIFGAALGLAAGAVIRRTLPALAATLGIMVATANRRSELRAPALSAASDQAHLARRLGYRPRWVDPDAALTHRHRYRRKCVEQRTPVGTPGRMQPVPRDHSCSDVLLPRRARLAGEAPLPTGEPVLGLPSDRVGNLSRTRGGACRRRVPRHPPRRVAAREKSRTFYRGQSSSISQDPAGLAQSAEHFTCNEDVVSSILTPGSKPFTDAFQESRREDSTTFKSRWLRMYCPAASSKGW